MKNQWLRMAPFPLALVAFAGIGVSYFNVIFTTSTRWVFLALLAGSLAYQGRLFSGLKTGFGATLLIYFGWCVGTSAWSEVPELSLLKSTAMIITAMTLLSGGHWWVTKSKPDKAFTYLLPVALLSLVASGGGANRATIVSPGLEIFAGLTGNPNFLGMLVAASFPYAIYLVYRAFYYRNLPYGGAFAYGLFGALCVTLWLSGSRASILCVLMTIFFSISVMATNKKIIVALTLCLGALATFVILPQLQASMYERFILKGSQTGEIFYSRFAPWEESYNAALQGGYLGLGYGVSAGDTDFEFGLTAETYGREKGNSQLAIWEETGLVGLALYAILLLGIFKELSRGLRIARGDNSTRIMLGTVFGMIVGLTIQSAFEAWWTAPGSLESAVFWAMLGVGIGIIQRLRASRRRPAPAAVRAPLVHVSLQHRTSEGGSAPV